MDKLNGGYNLIFMYLLSALAGNVYETIMFLFRRHKFVWSNGSITTPFNFVYGIGAVAIWDYMSLKDSAEQSRNLKRSDRNTERCSAESSNIFSPF